jgi:hypothetical protein
MSMTSTTRTTRQGKAGKGGNGGRGGKSGKDGRPEELRMLDELIRRSYRELLATIGENVKVGDFIKMLETRHKLMPTGADQREFWSMLERIRQETLSEDGEAEAVAVEGGTSVGGEDSHG